MKSSRVDRAAPRWIIQLLRGNPMPVPWARGVRAAVALTGPLIVGFLLGNTVYGALASMSALPSIVADVAGSYRYRAQRLGGALGAAVLGFALGLLVVDKPVASTVLVVVVAVTSALISAAGNNASIAALQLFIFTLLGSAQQYAEIVAPIAWLCFAAGALWSFLVALAGWPVRATSPERQAVAQVHIELAAMLSALAHRDQPTILAVRQQLTKAMNTAYDRLLEARSVLSGRDLTYYKLLNLLAATTPAVEASVAAVDAGTRPPRDVIEYFTTLANAVLLDAPLPEPPNGRPATSAHAQHSTQIIDALYRSLHRIGTEEERGRHARTPPQQHLRSWGRLLLSGPVTWLAALRLGICVTLAEVVSVLLPLERSYWVVLTVGVVLKPDFGSVFARAVLRALGTILGVGLGAGVLGLGVQNVPLIILAGLFATGVAIGKVYNHALLATFITPLIIVQMNFTTGGDWSLVLARLTDTVMGCAIVLVFGYLLWPGSLYPRLDERVAAAADTVAEYVAVGLRPVAAASDHAGRSRQRRRAYRDLSDLHTVFQQLVAEPSPGGRQAAQWSPAIVALEQLTDAATAVAVTIERGSPPPDEREVRMTTGGLAEIASAVRQRRDPAEFVLPRTTELADVADRLTAVVRAVRRAEPSRLPPGD